MVIVREPSVGADAEGLIAVKDMIMKDGGDYRGES